MDQRLTRGEQKARTRQQLVEAAFRCFEAQGFAATTLEQIAAEAGLTTGAVYSNFKNKEALFLELVGRIEPQPIDFSMLGDTSRTLTDRFRTFGATNAQDAGVSSTTMATWYELRAFALRNQRAHAAAHDTVLHYMDEWGERVDRLSHLIGAKPVVPGRTIALITQALLDGLRGMRAFVPDEITADVYGEATRLLAHLFDDESSVLTTDSDVSPGPSTPA